MRLRLFLAIAVVPFNLDRNIGYPPFSVKSGIIAEYVHSGLLSTKSVYRQIWIPIVGRPKSRPEPGKSREETVAQQERRDRFGGISLRESSRRARQRSQSTT